MKNWFKNLKFQNKLFLVFGILMFMVATLSIFAFSTIIRIEQSYIRLSEGPQQRLTYVSDAARELTTIHRYILSMGYTTDDAAIVEDYFDKYQNSAELFTQYMDAYYENVRTDTFLTAEERNSRIEKALSTKTLFNNEYRRYVNGIYLASIARDRQKVDELVLNGAPLGDEITEKLGELRTLLQEHADSIRLATQRHARNSRNAVVVLSVCIFVLSLLVSVFMPHIIKAPIVCMETAMKEIAKGNLAYPIRSGYKDELGALSESIGDMVDTISMLNKTVTIIDNLDDMIFVTDLDYNFLYLNQKAAEFYEVDRERILGGKCYEVIHKACIPCSFCPLPQLLPDKENLPSCDWTQFIEEKGIWMACRTSVIRWVDGSLTQIYTCKDDTLRRLHEENQERYAEDMRKAADAAMEASRMKSVFLANMSHEIRTPMNGIIGFSELALDDSILPKTKDYLDKIKSSSEGLLQIINDILDISKIEAGKISLENIPFDIHEVFRICQTVTTPKALEKGITLFCYAEPSVGKKLLGDPTRLRQALLNLLSNAVKFTNVGVVKLLSGVEKTTEDSISMRFEVKDSGIGMSPEQIDRIFEPFMQADDSTTRKFGGTGLGLAITRNIIELMGGKLKVESTPSVGSKFSFELTFRTIDVDSEAISHRPDVVILEKPVFKGNVLICEDNLMNQQVICDHLSRVGISAAIASNGKEAVDCVQNRIIEGEPAFDLIFMDIHMPVMDGLDAAKHLADIGNVSPIVALTANIMPNDREVYRQAGMPDCLAKPFTAQELWSCLLRYIMPIGSKAINKNEQSTADKKLHNQLLVNFWNDNQTTFSDITNAIEAGNIQLAHRQAHTLKGVAGLIGKSGLREAAYAVELSLTGGKTEVSPQQMNALEMELNFVMDELALKFDDFKPPETSFHKKADSAFDNSKSFKLIKDLESMLKVGNSDCLDLIDDLREIPGTEPLIEQMERFNFTAAGRTIAIIRQELEDGING